MGEIKGFCAQKVSDASKRKGGKGRRWKLLAANASDAIPTFCLTRPAYIITCEPPCQRQFIKHASFIEHDRDKTQNASTQYRAFISQFKAIMPSGGDFTRRSRLQPRPILRCLHWQRFQREAKRPNDTSGDHEQKTAFGEKTRRFIARKAPPGLQAMASNKHPTPLRSHCHLIRPPNARPRGRAAHLPTNRQAHSPD